MTLPTGLRLPYILPALGMRVGNVTSLGPNLAYFGIVKPKKEVYTQSRNQGIFPKFWQTLSNAAYCASNSWPLVLGLILFHLCRDQRLITAKSYLFTIGQTFNPSSMNNLLEFAFTLNTNGSNSLDAWASDTGRPPVVQIQENEVMQVASLCYTVQLLLCRAADRKAVLWTRFKYLFKDFWPKFWAMMMLSSQPLEIIIDSVTD